MTITIKEIYVCDQFQISVDDYIFSHWVTSFVLNEAYSDEHKPIGNITIYYDVTDPRLKNLVILFLVS